MRPTSTTSPGTEYQRERSLKVFRNDPAIRRNRRARIGDYIALGVTDGGRRIFSLADENGVRPITAWERE